MSSVRGRGRASGTSQGWLELWPETNLKHIWSKMIRVRVGVRLKLRARLMAYMMNCSKVTRVRVGGRLRVRLT